MRQQLTIILFLLPLLFFGQQQQKVKSNIIITPEIASGVMADANENFPDHDPPIIGLVSLGWEHDNNPQEWAQRLKGPRTGISLVYSYLGNSENLGSGISLMPFIEYNAFRKQNLKIHVGSGGTYFTKKYDPITNPNNKAITTDVTWSFRLLMHYQIFSGDKMDWRLGAGVFHHSNGHTRLPNQGLNSFLVSLSADIKNPADVKELTPTFNFERSVYSYMAMRAGYGINVLSEPEVFNDKKGVFTLTGEYGKVFNNTLRIGGGFYYRYYEHYFEYIDNNESLVQDGREFESYKDNPKWNASNIGLYGSAEFLFNHFGFEIQIGWNIHKPAYKIDWRINQGWDNTPREIPEYWMLGEYDTKYKLKQAISTRAGLKYYLIGTKDQPKNNIYLALHINSNLGQADFTELSLGYLYSFNFKDRSPRQDK